VCCYIKIGYLAGYVVRKRTYIIACMVSFCKVTVLSVRMYQALGLEAAEDLSEGISEEIAGLGQS
jgi:hypothetical protein